MYFFVLHSLSFLIKQFTSDFNHKSDFIKGYFHSFCFEHVKIPFIDNMAKSIWTPDNHLMKLNLTDLASLEFPSFKVQRI